MAYAYDAGMIDRIMPRIKQWEATTGRKISQSMLDALMKGQLSAEVDKAQQTRAIDLQEEQFANQKEQQKKAAKAASIKGYVDTASTAGMGYLTYKAVTKPSAMSEYLAAMKGTGAAGTGITDASIASASGSFSAPTAEAAGYGLTAPGYTAPAFTGAQTAIGGGTAAVGGQAALAGEAGSLAAYDASLAAGAAEGVGSTAGATTGSGVIGAVSPYIAPAAIALSGRPVGKLIAKTLGTHEKTTQDVTEAAAYAGAGFMIGGPVGAVVGGIIGGIKGIADSVICSELVRQGEITERDRTACVIFRFRYIPDDMFMAYLEWAEPIVRLMRNNRAANFFLVPFAMHFVGYMLAVQAKVEPTITERLVWKYAWWRCEKIARLAGQSVKEVAA